MRKQLLIVPLLALPLAAWAQPRGAMPVVVAPVVEQQVPLSLRLVGTVRPNQAATIAAEVSGVVATFEADDGDFLKKGDVICRIDDTVAKLRLAEAHATLASLQAALEELENGARVEDIARLEAQVAEAEALLSKWEFERQRVRALYERGQSSDKERHDTEMEYKAASRRLTQAQAELDKARNGARPEEIARAKQAVAAQEAVVRRLDRNVRKTSVRAAFDGALVQKRTEEGEWIEEGGAVCRMLALDVVRVRVDVPERAVAFARAGALASIEIEALGKSRSATITRVIPEATPSARTFPVEIDLDNADHTLLPGMFVWARVPAGPDEKRLMVPKDAIVARGTNAQVFVVQAQGDVEMATPTPVTTGLEINDRIEVHAAGLKVGDRVVTRANERLMGPTPVRPMPQLPRTEDASSANTPRSAAAKE